MKKLLLTLAFALLPLTASASFPIEVSLEEMARSADHIAVGRVVKVDLVDAAGKVSNDPNAKTGPCVGNTIQLHVRIDKVLATTAKNFPPLVKVPLDSMMHFTLGQVQAEHRGAQAPSLFLLKGPSFLPLMPGVFEVGLSERRKVLRIHAKAPRDKGAPDNFFTRDDSHCRSTS